MDAPYIEISSPACIHLTQKFLKCWKYFNLSVSCYASPQMWMCFYTNVTLAEGPVFFIGHKECTVLKMYVYFLNKLFWSWPFFQRWNFVFCEGAGADSKVRIYLLINYSTPKILHFSEINVVWTLGAVWNVSNAKIYNMRYLLECSEAVRIIKKSCL